MFQTPWCSAASPKCHVLWQGNPLPGWLFLFGGMFFIVFYHPRGKCEEVFFVNLLKISGVEILAFLVEVYLAIVTHAALEV